MKSFSSHMNEEGQIDLTVKTTGSFAKWGVTGMARQNKLVMKRVEDFPDVEYKHYICKNGAGDKPDNTFSTKDMKTFMFTKRVRKAATHLYRNPAIQAANDPLHHQAANDPLHL
ncbi:hypothetical protein Hdeb2414_s0016g00469991 [Helianthus debilis subsp. tardiflorus]